MRIDLGVGVASCRSHRPLFFPADESLPLLAALTGATLAQKELYDGLIRSWVDAGLWSKSAAILVFANLHSAADALIDWKTGTVIASLVQPTTPITWAAGMGFGTNGSDSYVSTGINPASASPISQNSNNMAAWFTAGVASDSSALGWFNGTNGFSLNPLTSGSGLTFRNNQAALSADASVSPALADIVGYTGSNRSGSGATQLYSRDGVAQTPSSNANQTSATLVSANIRIGASTASSHRAITAGIFAMRSSLSASEIEADAAIMNAFMTVAMP